MRLIPRERLTQLEDPHRGAESLLIHLQIPVTYDGLAHASPPLPISPSPTLPLRFSTYRERIRVVADRIVAADILHTIAAALGDSRGKRRAGIGKRAADVGAKVS